MRSRWTILGWRLAIAAALTLIVLNRLPLTATSLLDAATRLHTQQPGPRMLHIYSAVQGRPTETCDTFPAQQERVLAEIAAEVAAAQVEGPIAGPLSTLSIFDRRIRELFGAKPAASCWKEFADYGYFQGGFPVDAPYIWTFSRFGLSTAHIALALIVGSWAGLVCLFLIVRRLSGSMLVALATVVLNDIVWRAWQFPAGSYLSLLNCFVPIYLAMWLATPAQEQGLRGMRLLALEVALIVVFIPDAFLQGFIYPFTHRVNGTLAVVCVLAVGLMRLNSRVVIRGVAMLAGFSLFCLPFYRDVNGLYSQLTAQNLAASEGFTEGQMAMSLYERPTYLGLPNGDYGFTWMHAIDPYLYYTAPHLVVHQTFKYFGATLMNDVLTTRPLALVGAFGRRLFIQTAYHHRLYFWWYRGWGTDAVWRYAGVTASFLAVAAVGLWSLMRERRWPVMWPLAFFIGWHAFGVNTVLTIVHTHDHYVLSGAILLMSLAPAIVMFALREARRERRQPTSPPVVFSWLRSRWPISPRLSVIGATIAMLLLTPGMVTAARQEMAVFWLWFPVHVVSDPHRNFEAELWRSPQQLREQADRLDRLGESDAGVNDMYAAWIFWVYRNQNAVFARGPGRGDPDAQKRFQAEAQTYIDQSYRAALDAAPDNPNYASYALMINAPDWPEIFRRAINKFPEYHHTPYMAYQMIFQAKTNTPEERTRFIQVYEDGMGRTLARSAADRPGYQWRPTVTAVPANGIAAAGKETVARGELTLQTGDSLLLDPIAIRGAPKMRIGIYVYVPEGQVQTMAVDAAGAVVPSCSQFTSSYLDALHYRYVECATIEHIESLRLRVTALQPTRLVIRDYYPLFSVVRTAKP